MKQKNLFMYVLSMVVAFVASVFGGSVLMAMAAPVPGAGQSNIPTDAVSGDISRNGAEGVATHVTNEGLTQGTTTDDYRHASEDLLIDPLDREILKMYQTGVPIDQITRMTPAIETNGMRYKFYQVDTRVNKATATAYAAGAGNKTGTLTIADGKAELFDTTDILMFPSVPGWDSKSNAYYNANLPYFPALNVYVRNVNADSLEIMAINGAPSDTEDNVYLLPSDAITAAIAAGDFIVIRLGHAASEGEILTANYAAFPTKSENFMQIFKAQSLESTISAKSDHEVQWDKTDSDLLMMGNLRQEIEATYLFGQKGYTYNSAKKRMVYTTSGIIEQISKGGKVLTYDKNNVTDSEWIDIQREIFIGNNGSDTRLILAGSAFVAALAKADRTTRTIGARDTEVIFGFKWHKLESNFGSLNMMMHPLFDQIPGWEDRAIVIDPQHMRKRVFSSMWRQVLALKEAGIFDGEGSVLTEISSLCLKYPKCHAIIVPKKG